MMHIQGTRPSSSSSEGPSFSTDVGAATASFSSGLSRDARLERELVSTLEWVRNAPAVNVSPHGSEAEAAGGKRKSELSPPRPLKRLRTEVSRGVGVGPDMLQEIADERCAVPLLSADESMDDSSPDDRGVVKKITAMTGYVQDQFEKFKKASPQEKQTILNDVSLVISEFFDHPELHRQPVPVYIDLADQVGKWAPLNAGQRILSWLAERIMSEAQLTGLHCQQASRLVKALAQNPEETVCQLAILRLTQHVKISSTCFIPEQSQATAFYLHGLSQCMTFKDDAQHIVSSLAMQMRANAPLLEAMNSQELVKSLNALSQWPHDGLMKQVAVMLADRLAYRRPLWGYCMELNAQEVATVLRALSQWPDEAAMEKAAYFLVDRIVMNKELYLAMNSTEVRTTFVALSQWFPEHWWARQGALILTEWFDQDEPLQQMLNAPEMAGLLQGSNRGTDEMEVQEDVP